MEFYNNYMSKTKLVYKKDCKSNYKFLYKEEMWIIKIFSGRSQFIWDYGLM